MTLYQKWGVKTGFTFALQFSMLISDGLGGVENDELINCDSFCWIYLCPQNSGLKNYSYFELGKWQVVKNIEMNFEIRYHILSGL